MSESLEKCDVIFYALIEVVLETFLKPLPKAIHNLCLKIQNTGMVVSAVTELISPCGLI